MRHPGKSSHISDLQRPYKKENEKEKSSDMQYVSKFGKLSSGHRTGKGQFSFQSQKMAMTKNTQTTAQLHTSHTLAK